MTDRIATQQQDGMVGRILGWFRMPGVLLALPNMLLLLLFFAVPLGVLVLLSFMPAGSFGLGSVLTLENYGRVFTAGYYRTFLWSVLLATMATLLLLAICYPVAVGLARTFGRWTPVLTLLFVAPLFVSETIRLYGWTLFFLKGGILNGLLRTLGIGEVEMMYSIPAVVIGLANIYLPFMLFPLTLGIALIPKELLAAARDLGCSRWQAFWRVELPLSRPGLIIGTLLTFIMTLGSMSESKILGGRRVVMVADDIELAFGYQQNWPLGSALSVILGGLSLVLLVVLLRKADLGALVGKD